MTLFDVLRVFFSAVLFIYVSYKDIKTREINDIIWLVFGTLGVIINIFEIFTGSLDIVTVGITVLITVGFAILTGYLGLFGEADLLAFIVLGLLNPRIPNLGFDQLLFPPVIFTLSVITNSILFGALSIFVVLIYNISSITRVNVFNEYKKINLFEKVILLSTGVNKKIGEIRGPPFEYPLEKVGEDQLVHIVLRPDFSDDEEANNTLKKLNEIGRKRVWISYGLPFLLFLGIGYFATLFLGDIILFFISTFFRL